MDTVKKSSRNHRRRENKKKYSNEKHGVEFLGLTLNERMTGESDCDHPGEECEYVLVTDNIDFTPYEKALPTLAKLCREGARFSSWRCCKKQRQR